MTIQKPGLDYLTVFVAVAEAGGFTAAAGRLGTTKAMVSQRIASLEARLRTTLFTRSTRKVVLTQAGERLLAESAPLLARLQEVMDAAGQETSDLLGLLRVTAGVDHLVSGLAQLLADFAALHPRLQLDVIATDELVDLIGDGVDVAIRRGWLRDSSLTATSLGSFEQVLVAAPAYVARHGSPTSPRELSNHRAIVLTRLRAPLTWEFSGPGRESVVVRVKATVTCNSPLGVVALARAGAGMTVVGAPTVAEDLEEGRLKALLPRWRLPPAGIFAVFPATRHVPPKTRALIDFLKAKLKAHARP